MANILLVDPNVAFRRMMEQILRQEGHEVWGADDAETAGRSMKDQEFDLAVVELVLSGEMSGSQLLEWLRDFPPPGDPARVALSSHESFAQQEAYLRTEYSLDGFLSKPFKPSQFRQLVGDALAARAARPKDGRKPMFAPPPQQDMVLQLDTADLLPLETNPGLIDEPAPSIADFETASGEAAISLDDLAPPPATSERRAVPRHAVRLPVAVHDGAKPFRARSVNLGRGGIFVSTDHPLEMGGTVRVRLELPVPGPGFNEIVTRVVHAHESGGATGYGLKFSEMSAETARRLDGFLEELARPSQQRPFLVVASASLSPEVERIAQGFRDDELRVRQVEAEDDVQRIAEDDPPDIMLLDLGTIAGDTASRAQSAVILSVGALKSTRATSRIPVGLVDRSGNPQVALVAAAAGADRFFVLPADLERLVSFSTDTLIASRRRSVRVRFQRPASVWADGVEYRGATVDLSETGIQVRLGQRFDEGTRVEVVVRLSDGLEPLRIPAKVTWISAASDGAALGMKVGLLLDADEQARGRIRDEVGRALTVSYYVRWLASAPKGARSGTARARG